LLSKTDFMTYLQSPMHLWAKKHNRFDILEPNRFKNYLIDQGKEVEMLAERFITDRFSISCPAHEIFFQRTVIDHPFATRIDAGIFDSKNNTWDIIEIKSSSSVRKDDIYDLAFSMLVCETSFEIRNIYLVTLNHEYELGERLEIQELFRAVDISKEVKDVKPMIKKERDAAYQIMRQNSPEGITGCIKPKECPCQSLCHPSLPKYPVFDILYLSRKKLEGLLNQGIISMLDIPAGFPLSDRQNRQLECVKQGRPLINLSVIKKELAKLKYPLCFLDYETYNPGIPKSAGHRPFQVIVFQYSLHIINQPEGDLFHSGYLSENYLNP